MNTEINNEKNTVITLAEKIRMERSKLGLSQEALANDLCVSRSTIAKWENGNGIPEIDNLKLLAKKFDVSIDYLLNEEFTDPSASAKEITSVNVDEEDNSLDYYKEYIGKICDIELTDWNDGVFKAFITGQDNHFLFYQIQTRKKELFGLITKRYIKEIKICKGKKSHPQYHVTEPTVDFFLRKKADIYLNDKHIWDGILGEDTELLNVTITKIDGNSLVLEPGTKQMEFEQIARIEVAEEKLS